MYVLFHEILHFYLNNQPPPMVQDGSSEVCEPNQAAALSSLDAISNAQSYVFYVASKSSPIQISATLLGRKADFLSFPVLQQNCAVPTVTPPAAGSGVCQGRCLLEVGEVSDDLVADHLTINGVLQF